MIALELMVGISPDLHGFIIETSLKADKILVILTHTCQVLSKSKNETELAPLIYVYNLVIEREEKSTAQVLRVKFFASL